MTSEEMNLALKSLEMALEAGARKARATLTKSTEDLVATLDGEVDRITHCADSSLDLALFVDGRFGTFATNRITEEDLRDFVRKSVAMTRMLAPDPCRDLPSPDICCRNARDGREMDIYDDAYEDVSPGQRVKTALDEAATGRCGSDGDWELISEEGEYSDSLYETFVCDTAGLRCLQRETSFDYGVEVTLEDSEGGKYSSYWWNSSPRLKDYLAGVGSCGRTAISRAASQIGADAAPGGKYNMVVGTEVASKMVSPLLNALNGYSIQQNNSFLLDSMGKKLFHEGFTLLDKPHIKGESGSKLFDSEGAATKEAAVIENGVVKRYFINSYMSRKLDMAQNQEEATRPCVQPWPREGMGKEEIMGLCGNGILVTDFNGGNSNSATGDFSFGISGFLFKGGKIMKPVSGMVVTGNFIDLWNRFIAAGDDARRCCSKLIPTLAFADVDFSGQ